MDANDRRLANPHRDGRRRRDGCVALQSHGDARERAAIVDDLGALVVGYLLADDVGSCRGRQFRSSDRAAAPPLRCLHRGLRERGGRPRMTVVRAR